MVNITASVGQGGANRAADVLAIQKALNQIPPAKGGPDPKLAEDSRIGPKTIGAIVKFQRAHAGLVADGRVDAGGPTLAKINTLLAPQPVPPPPAPNFTDKNLYRGGGPSPNDIKQDAFGDCYFVATLGAVAQQNPQLIRNAIHYDPVTQRFRVKLYDLKGSLKLIWVTQKELEDNVKRHGGSYVDNTGKYERTWPAVIETAYAKMFDTNPKDGLGEGYQKIINGGWPSDAMMAITGSAGTELKYKHYPSLGMAGSVALLGAKVSTALTQKKAVTLWVVPEKDNRTFWQVITGAPVAQDGLVDDHVYAVVSIARSGMDWKVTVRNPWGHNINVGEGRDSKGALMIVSLQKLVQTGGLEAFQASK